MTRLELMGKRLRCADAVVIAALVRDNHSLRELELGCNEIGRHGAMALFDAVSDHPTLTALGCADNVVDQEAAEALAKDTLRRPAGSGGCRLRSLDLSNNKIGPKGAAAVIDALARRGM